MVLFNTTKPNASSLISVNEIIQNPMSYVNALEEIARISKLYRIDNSNVVCKDPRQDSNCIDVSGKLNSHVISTVASIGYQGAQRFGFPI
jgi:hypothetical protein